MTPQTILGKIRALGEAMLQPHVVHLWYDSNGWLLEIQNYAWLEHGAPKAEVIDWLTELSLAEGTTGFVINPPAGKSSLAGVTLSGGERAPSMYIQLPGSLSLMDQYEAMLVQVAVELTLYGSGQGSTFRIFAFADFMPDDWHSGRRRDEEMRGKSVASFGWNIPNAKKLKTGAQFRKRR